MTLIGEHIRRLREEKSLPLRTVAAFLDIDQAILSKIERGHKKATRNQVTLLANYFHIEEKELLKEWLSDKVLYEIRDEEMALEVLKVAESYLKYGRPIIED